MIPTDVFTLIGRLTVAVFAIYFILIVPYVAITLLILIVEAFLIRVNNYIFKKFGGDSQRPPDKYEKEIMWLYRKTVVPVREFRRWYWEKTYWYDRKILGRLPGL